MTLLRATHRVDTPDHPPCFCLTEDSALDTAEQRLPRSSVIWIHSIHHRTREETWEFLRPYP